MKTSTVALIATGVVATLGLGYLVYFDSQRRSNPEFRKQLSKFFLEDLKNNAYTFSPKKKLGREKKKAAKDAEKAEKNSKESKLKLIEKVIVECARENYPTTPEQKEKYFMEQVAAGEQLCGQGKLFLVS